MQTESGTRPVLEVADLTLSFGGLHALSKVSFAVQEGTIAAVIGPNGAGKTSLFNCISGFYRPQHGAHLVSRPAISRACIRRNAPSLALRARSRISRCSAA